MCYSLKNETLQNYNGALEKRSLNANSWIVALCGTVDFAAFFTGKVYSSHCTRGPLQKDCISHIELLIKLIKLHMNKLG